MKTLKVRLNFANGGTEVLKGRMRKKDFQHAFDTWCQLAVNNNWSYFIGKEHDLVINVK